MKKAKRKAVILFILFLLAVAGGVYAVLFGLGKEKNGTEADTASTTDAAQIGRAKDIALGLDLKGGVSVTYQIQESNPSSEEIDATIDKLQRRVDTYSPDGEVYKEGSDRITVEIPVDTSKYDPNAILDDLGRPGELLFFDEENITKFFTGTEYTAALTGADIKDANAAIQSGTTGDDYVVQLTFTDEGTQKFADVTAANVGKIVYIVYDNQIVSMPTVKSAITGGSAVIEGQANIEEAKQLASTIKIGALPLTLSELRSQIVGAKLGNDAVDTSLIAGLIGICIIFLIMIVVFRFPGFLASLALCTYIILELFFLQTLHITLTLPGLAGIILSIGMAVDANVIIFTRIKEEIAAGKGVKGAVQAGFAKATSAIVDGNVTTIIAGIVLLYMGSGTVKGFARTLILGIVLSMITSLFITRFLLYVFTTLGVTSEKLYGRAKKVEVKQFSKYFKITGAISVLLIVLGIAFLFVNLGIGGRGKAMNFSLEFSGGTSTTVAFDKSYTLEEAEKEVRPVVAEAAGVSEGSIQIQIVDENNQIVFKTAELSEEKRAAVSKAIQEKFGVNSEDIEAENISSTISKEMQKDAILAVVIASILMLIYIAFRFSDTKFGISAVIALIHDVMIVFMVYSVAYLSVGSTFIACMLTILGYSINATIVIFDRIRENLKVMSPESDGYEKIVNTSITQTLSRNIYSSLTTFVTVLILYIMGVAAIKDFTLTLMVGILCGTYSSIFITGPLWLAFKKRSLRKAEVEAILAKGEKKKNKK
jgi:SecD/SecF fusion protein